MATTCGPTGKLKGLGMDTLVEVSLILGAVLGMIYIIRDYVRDGTRTRMQLLKEDLEEEASPEQ